MASQVKPAVAGQAGQADVGEPAAQMTLERLTEGLNYATEHINGADELRKFLEQQQREARSLMKKVLAWERSCKGKMKDVPAEMQSVIEELFKAGWQGLRTELRTCAEQYEVIDLAADQPVTIPDEMVQDEEGEEKIAF